MSDHRLPFKSDYSGEDSNTVAGPPAPESRMPPGQAPVVAEAVTEAPSIESYLRRGTETPLTSKPLGAEKPRRIRVRGKISQ